MNFFEKVKNWFKSVWQGIKAFWNKLFRKSKAQTEEKQKAVKEPKNKLQPESEGNMFRIICSWIYKLRSVFLSIPVLFVSILLAVKNRSHLPETVHLIPESVLEKLKQDAMNAVPPRDYFYFPNDREFIEKISTLTLNQAVYGPLLITVLCLVMMFLSRRVTLPWIISIFSLILPPFIYLIVQFYA